MKVTIVTDNKKSWMVPYMRQALSRMKIRYHARLIFTHTIPQGNDVAFFISCEKIVTEKILARSRHNLVVHESALPKGRGMSPMTWQIIEGKSAVPITLFEAQKSLDSGKIYLQSTMRFRGHELVDELRAAQGQATIDLMLRFLARYKNLQGRKQVGRPTFYRRRTQADSELNIHKSLASQFPLLRVVDNERYPAFFQYKGHKYIVKISKAPKA